GGIIDPRENAARLPVIDGTLHGDDSLPHGRQHLFDGEFVRDPVGEPYPLQSRTRHDQGVRWTDRSPARQPLLLQMVELAYAGVGRAAIMNDLDLRKQPA